MQKLKYLITIISISVILVSCSAPQKTVYFSESTPQNPHVQVDNIEPIKELKILPKDILAINVSTISSLNYSATPGATDPAAPFNNGGTNYAVSASVGGGPGGGGGGSNKGFLVDDGGYIDYPLIGKLKISGLTLREVKDLLARRLEAYVKEPVVEARIINFTVTILGEIGSPGKIIAPNHKINILDAVAAAGDIPITGRKDNVLIIRETEGKREYARLNLNSKDVFQSPYYYLKQNDVIYVEPGRVKKQENNDFLRFYLPTATTLISAGLTFYSISQLANR